MPSYLEMNTRKKFCKNSKVTAAINFRLKDVEQSGFSYKSDPYYLSSKKIRIFYTIHLIPVVTSN